jgi:hypothetical protein
MTSISTTAERVADGTRNAALTARDSLIELGTQSLRLADNLRKQGFELFIANVGRRRDKGRLPSVWWFAAGAVVVGGGALLLGSPGRALRVRVRNLVHRSDDKSASREREAEDNMANEGGASRPRTEEHGREASN